MYLSPSSRTPDTCTGVCRQPFPCPCLRCACRQHRAPRHATKPSATGGARVTAMDTRGSRWCSRSVVGGGRARGERGAAWAHRGRFRHRPSHRPLVLRVACNTPVPPTTDLNFVNEALRTAKWRAQQAATAPARLNLTSVSEHMHAARVGLMAYASIFPTAVNTIMPVPHTSHFFL